MTVILIQGTVSTTKYVGDHADAEPSIFGIALTGYNGLMFFGQRLSRLIISFFVAFLPLSLLRCR